MAKVLSYEDGIAAVYGGAILGGGGGGLLEEGLKLVEEIFAAGTPQLMDISELNHEDLVACVAMVGAPSAA
uniref:S-methyl thiohydantoin desulfurase domain-containing protein n=2 Tax=Lysinibacillus TaxID=400634 RepID=UPI000564B42F